LNFAIPADNANYGKVSITLTGGTVDQGDLITLNITLVLPANAKSAPSMTDQAADDAFVAWIVSGVGRAQLKKAATRSLQRSTSVPHPRTPRRQRCLRMC